MFGKRLQYSIKDDIIKEQEKDCSLINVLEMNQVIVWDFNALVRL